MVEKKFPTIILSDGLEIIHPRYQKPSHGMAIHIRRPKVQERVEAQRSISKSETPERPSIVTVNGQEIQSSGFVESAVRGLKEARRYRMHQLESRVIAWELNDERVNSSEVWQGYADAKAEWSSLRWQVGLIPASRLEDDLIELDFDAERFGIDMEVAHKRFDGIVGTVLSAEERSRYQRDLNQRLQGDL